LQIIAGRPDQSVEPVAFPLEGGDLRLELADPRLPGVPLHPSFGERAFDVLALGEKAGELRAGRFDV